MPLPRPRAVLSAVPAVACTLALFALALGGGNWREPLLLAAPLPLVAALLRRVHARAAGAADGLDTALTRGCLGYALLALTLAGLDALAQVRLAELFSPLVANPIEGREALKGWLTATGQTIYPRAEPGYPRLITLYPPLYFVVTAALTFLAGPGLLAGKLAAALGGAAMLGALYGLGRLAGGRLIGLAAALAFFATPEAGNAFACKPDTVAFGCLLAGALAFEAGRVRASTRLLFLSGVLVAAACFGKQQVWPMALAFAAGALISPRPRVQGLFALAGLAATGLVLGGAFFWHFGPGLVEQTVLFPKAMTGLASDNSLESALARLSAYGLGHWPLLGAYGLWLGLCAVRRRLPMPDLLLLASLPALVRTLMWGGSDTNHFLFASAVASLGAVSLVGRLREGSPAAKGLAVLALAALVPVGITLHRPSAFMLGPRPADVAEAEAVRAVLAAVDGPVLMDAEGAHLFAGRPDFARLRLYDAFETDMYDRLGLAPMADSPMAADIVGRRVARFVDSQVFISRTLLSLVALYYQPAERLGRYAFYRPRPDTGLIAMPVADRVSRGDGGYAAVVVRAENLRNWGSYIQAEDPARPLVLAYAVTGDRPARTARVSYCLRLTEPGQAAAVVVRDAGGRELARAAHVYGDVPQRGEGFDNRLELAFAPHADRFTVTFELTGPAQLWLDRVHPLLFGATASSDGDGSAN